MNQRMKDLEARHLEIHRIYQRIPLMRRGRQNKLRRRLQKEHDELAPELDDHPVWDGLDGIDDVVLVDFDDQQVIIKTKEGVIAISDDEVPYAIMRFPWTKELPYFEKHTYTVYPFMKVEQAGVLDRYSYVIHYKGVKLAVGDRQPDVKPDVIISRRNLKGGRLFLQKREAQTLSIQLSYPEWAIVSLGDRAQLNGRHFCLGVQEGDFKILVDPSIPRDKLPEEWQNPDALLVTQVDKDHWRNIEEFEGTPLYSVAAILNQIPYRKKRAIRGPKIGKIRVHPFKTTHKVGVPSIGVRFDFRDGTQVSVIPEFLELGQFAKNLITDTIWIVGVGDYKEDDIKEGKLSYQSLLELADELKPKAIWLTNIRRSLDDRLKGIDKELREHWNGGVFYKGMVLSSNKEAEKSKDSKKVPFWTWAKPAYRIFEVEDLELTPNWEPDDRVVLETKCDGLRVQPIVYEDGRIEIWTDPDDIKGPPEEAERSSRLPVIVKELASMNLKGRWRFDGELVAIKGKEALHRTVINSCLTGKFSPEKCADLAHLFIFDVLEAESKDVRSYPLKERLEILAKLKDTDHIFFSRPSVNLKEKGHFGYVMRVRDITEEWLNQMANQKITDPIEVEKLSEGAMIKKLDAPYEAPHNKGSIKWKKEREIDVLVVDKKEIYRLGKPTGNYNYTIAVGPLTEREAKLIREKDKDRVVEFRGKYWNVLGKTDNTKIDVEVGDIIRIAAEEVIEYETDDPEVKYYSTYIARVLQPVPERNIPDTLEVPRRLAALEPRRVSLVEKGRGFFSLKGEIPINKKLAASLPPHKTYVEATCGAGEVFWYKEPSEVEVLNDINPDIMRLYRIVKRLKPEDFAQLSKYNWVGDEEYYINLQKRGKPKDDLAFLHWYMYLTRFGWKFRGDPAKDSFRKTDQGKEMRWRERLEKAKERLQHVKLENKDYTEVIKEYDSNDTLFFFDPPYPGREVYYDTEPFDYIRLAKVLKQIKGKFILCSILPDDIKSHFKNFYIQTISWKSPLSQFGGKDQELCIISNFKFDLKGVVKKKEKYNIKEFIEQGHIPKEIYIKIAKPNEPLPPEFYVDSREGVAWAQTHVRGLEPEDVEKFKQGKLSLADLFVGHSIHVDLRMDLGLPKLVQWVITDNDVESYFKMMLGQLRETKGGVMNVAHSLCIIKPSSEPPETEKPKIKKATLEEPSIDKEGAKLLEKYQIISGSYFIPAGGVGASAYKAAWMGLIWSGRVKTGVARPDYHEYFFYPDDDLPELNKKLFNGRFIIKCLEDHGDRRWEIWKAVRDPKPADPILHKDTGYHWPLKAEEVPALGKEHYEYGKKEPVR